MTRLCPLLACAVLLPLGCGPSPIVVAAPEPSPVEPAPGPVVVRAAPAVLQVAGPSSSARRITVDARAPRTPLGRYRAGERVRISVLETRWSFGPHEAPYDASGKPDQLCGSPGHRCLGGDGVAPLMGLILLTAPARPALPAAAACEPQHRLFIPHGVEFTVPEEVEMALAPNDREDALEDNVGALRVVVETAPAPHARATDRRELSVDARRARTPLGSFHAGQYVRISTLGGKWTRGPGGAAVAAAGVSGAQCVAWGGHACIGGDRAVPLMGLMLLLGPCAASRPAPEEAVERRFIPRGADFVVIRESDLFLAPNDWEDGLDDNTGSAVVEVEASR